MCEGVYVFFFLHITVFLISNKRQFFVYFGGYMSCTKLSKKTLKFRIYKIINSLGIFTNVLNEYRIFLVFNYNSLIKIIILLNFEVKSKER